MLNKITNNKNKLKANKNILAFTLIEIMVWILIVVTVIIWWFQALTAVTIWKAKLIEQVNIQKESFYFTEKLFEMIKQWWTLDYEEYFNRKIIWNTTYSSWHFAINSWFGNFWSGWVVWTNYYWEWFYYCRSNNGLVKMSWTWCVTDNNDWGGSYEWKNQRYWQYSFQFIDYNSNHDDDLWDENGDWSIIGDDDDEFIWDWPEVFQSGSFMPELYLISGNKKERTYFRWTVRLDENAPIWSTCDVINATWSWCIWTVEYLKLIWKDWWMNHGKDPSDDKYLDWVIDTWIIDPQFTWWVVDVIAWSNNDNYWVKLFSDSINVSEFSLTSFPNKELKYAWKNNDKSVNISPYTILKIQLKPSWLTRKKLKSEWQELNYSITINLSDIYSQ